MGECGCTTNDKHYRFPGPGKSFYVLTIAGRCIDCCTPAGITIEHVRKGDGLYEWYKCDDYVDGDLKLVDWSGMCRGVAIKTFPLQNEFASQLAGWLAGTECGDERDARELLSEMYEDLEFTPELVQPHESKEAT